MNPEQQPQPQSGPQQPPAKPLFNEPFESPLEKAPVVGQMSAPEPAPEDQGKNKLVLIVIAAGVSLLIIIILIVVVASSSSNKTGQKTQDAEKQSMELGPATSTTVQQTNDSISQDIGNLNDDEDFPSNKLSDDSLNL